MRNSYIIHQLYELNCDKFGIQLKWSLPMLGWLNGLGICQTGANLQMWFSKARNEINLCLNVTFSISSIQQQIPFANNDTRHKHIPAVSIDNITDFAVEVCALCVYFAV